MPVICALPAFVTLVRPFSPVNENWKSSQSSRNTAPFQRTRPPKLVFQPTS